MDKRLFVNDYDFLRASGYEAFSGPESNPVPEPVNWERVAYFVLNMSSVSRRSDQSKPHWKQWGYDLV